MSKLHHSPQPLVLQSARRHRKDLPENILLICVDMFLQLSTDCRKGFPCDAYDYPVLVSNFRIWLFSCDTSSKLIEDAASDKHCSEQPQNAAAFEVITMILKSQPEKQPGTCTAAVVLPPILRCYCYYLREAKAHFKRLCAGSVARAWYSSVRISDSLSVKES